MEGSKKDARIVEAPRYVYMAETNTLVRNVEDPKFVSITKGGVCARIQSV